MVVNPNNIEKFRKEFEQLMSGLEKKHGVSIDLGRITYDSTMFRGKLTVKQGERELKKSTREYIPQVGDRVSINHKKVSSDRKFTVIKVNRVGSRVREIGGKGGQIKVSNSLLVQI